MSVPFDVDVVREVYGHMAWADAKVWSAVAGSEPAVRDDGVRDKLVHIHLVQRVFLDTWRGRPWAPPTPEQTRDLAAVRAWAFPYYGDVKAFLERADDDALSLPLPEAFARQIEASLGSGERCPTIAESAFQVASHSTHHRGQLNTRLRELGAEPPTWDYIAWVWWGRPAPEWPD